jgi:hypothetical protein
MILGLLGYRNFKVAMKKWFASSSEEKFNVFKAVDFYDL